MGPQKQSGFWPTLYVSWVPGSRYWTGSFGGNSNTFLFLVDILKLVHKVAAVMWPLAISNVLSLCQCLLQSELLNRHSELLDSKLCSVI